MKSHLVPRIQFISDGRTRTLTALKAETKVPQIRIELVDRGLPTDGGKAQLVERLFPFFVPPLPPNTSSALYGGQKRKAPSTPQDATSAPPARKRKTTATTSPQDQTPATPSRKRKASASPSHQAGSTNASGSVQATADGSKRRATTAGGPSKSAARLSQSGKAGSDSEMPEADPSKVPSDTQEIRESQSDEARETTRGLNNDTIEDPRDTPCDCSDCDENIFEVEYGSIPIPQLTCGDFNFTTKAYRQKEDDQFAEWMQTIVVSYSLEGKEVHRAMARYVDRDSIRGDFWKKMKATPELSSIAFELFDRYGRLKKQYIDHPVRKGTGCWGDELDYGNILIIEDVGVCGGPHGEFQCKGEVQDIVRCLIKKAHAKRFNIVPPHFERKPAICIVRPGNLARAIWPGCECMSLKERREARKWSHTVAEKFYRDLGFRRIGLSNCFCLSFNLIHKSWNLLASKDFNPKPLRHQYELDILEPGEYCCMELECDGTKALWVRMPLHHATLHLSDDLCVGFYEEFARFGNDADWTKVDPLSNNLLHMAAKNSNVKAVKWLMANADHNKRLSIARNRSGYTPLESFEDLLERHRTVKSEGDVTILVSDAFRGFSSNQVDCLAALRNSVFSISSGQMICFKYGCTCGRCIDGFFSLRMRLTLQRQAKKSIEDLKQLVTRLAHKAQELANKKAAREADYSNDNEYKDAQDKKDAEEWEDVLWMTRKELDRDYPHLAPAVREKFTTDRSVGYGTVNVFMMTLAILNNNQYPTPERVLVAGKTNVEALSDTTAFYDAGGTANDVFRCIFEVVKYEDPLAGYTGKVWDRSAFAHDMEMLRLPTCRNDHEYGFVALACGVHDLGQPLPQGDVYEHMRKARDRRENLYWGYSDVDENEEHPPPVWSCPSVPSPVPVSEGEEDFDEDALDRRTPRRVLTASEEEARKEAQERDYWRNVEILRQHGFTDAAYSYVL